MSAATATRAFAGPVRRRRSPSVAQRDLRLREPSQLGGAVGPLQRAGEDERERVGAAQVPQHGGRRSGLLLAVRRERYVGEPGVPAGLRPLGLPVAEQKQVAHEARLSWPPTSC